MMKRAERRLAIKSNYSKGARDLKPLTPSQPVYYQYKEGRRPEWRRGIVWTEHSQRSYIIDERCIYGKQSAPTLSTPETSSENSSSPASALNSHKLQEHMDTKKSQDANRLNKSQADSPTRPKRIRKETDWFKGYDFNF